MLATVTADMERAMDERRRELSAPLPRDFADRVLARVSTVRPVITRAGVLTTLAAAVIVAALVTARLDRAKPSAGPPPIQAFSTSLLAP